MALLPRPAWATDIRAESIVGAELLTTFSTSRQVQAGLERWPDEQITAYLSWTVGVEAGTDGLAASAEPPSVYIPDCLDPQGCHALALDDAQAFAEALLELVALGRGQRLQGGAR